MSSMPQVYPGYFLAVEVGLEPSHLVDQAVLPPWRDVVPPAGRTDWSSPPAALSVWAVSEVRLQVAGIHLVEPPEML